MRSILLALCAALATCCSAVAQPAPATPVRVGMISRTFYYVPFWAARDLGYYKAEGLDVSLSVMTDTTAQVPALLEGKLDLTVAPTEGILKNADEGGPLRIIAGNSGKLSHFVIAQPRFKRIEDLKGARIGILSLTEGSRFHFEQIAAAHGLKPGDYSLVETGGAPARHTLLKEQKIDVGLQSIPWSFVAEDEGLANLADVASYIPDWQFTTVNANQVWADRHPEEVVRFLRATQRAVDWLYANRAEASAIAARELGIKLGYAERAWDYFTRTGNITRDLSVNTPGLIKVAETMRRAGILKETGPVEAARYVDGRYLARSRDIVFATGPFLKTSEETRALFDKLFADVAGRAGTGHRTVVFADWKEVGAALLSGQVDVAWMGGASRYAAAKLAGGGPVLATVLYDGKPSYRTIFIAKNGLSVTDFPRGAKGLTLQLTHRNSTSGWLVPYAYLADQGMQPQTDFTYRDGTQHSDNERMVAGGQADIVSDSDNNREAMIKSGSIKPDDGRVIWTSEPVPLDPIQARAGLSPALVETLRAAFVGVSPDKAASLMMPRYTGFAPARDEDYAQIVDAWRRYGSK